MLSVEDRTYSLKANVDNSSKEHQQQQRHPVRLRLSRRRRRHQPVGSGSRSHPLSAIDLDNDELERRLFESCTDDDSTNKSSVHVLDMNVQVLPAGQIFEIPVRLVRSLATVAAQKPVKLERLNALEGIFILLIQKTQITEHICMIYDYFRASFLRCTTIVGPQRRRGQPDRG